MKTAISIPDKLFADIESFLQERGGSRSEFFAKAAERYLQQQRNRQILEELNAVYAEGEAEEDVELRRLANRHRAEAMKGNSW
jgi:metal-responsive CopG/Arc/MetJ family transcriptional regulator